jgi:hypothetical protein
MVMVLAALLFLLLSAAVYLIRTAIGPVSPEAYYFLLGGLFFASLGLVMAFRGYRRVD